MAVDNVARGIASKNSNAKNIAVTDEGGFYSSDTVEGALQEIAAAVDKLTYVSPTVTFSMSGTNGVEEIGSTVSAVTLKAVADKECKTMKLFSNGTLLETVNNAKSIEKTVNNISTATTFIAIITDKYDKDTPKTKTLSFYNGVYYGVGAEETAISDLSKKLQGSNNCEFSGNAGEGQYFFFASPTRYGTPSFKDKDTGFGADFTLVDGNVSFTNASGYTEAYQLYRSTHPALGQTTITVY